MTRALKLLHELKDPSDAKVYLGSNVTRSDISIAGDNYFQTIFTVSDNYNVETLWNTGDGGLTTFSHGVIVSDQDVLVELRNDAGTAEFTLIEVKANCPCYIGGSAGGNTSTALTDETETTPDDIDRIQVQRNVADAAGDATVTLTLFS